MARLFRKEGERAQGSLRLYWQRIKDVAIADVNVILTWRRQGRAPSSSSRRCYSNPISATPTVRLVFGRRQRALGVNRHERSRVPAALPSGVAAAVRGKRQPAAVASRPRGRR